MKKIFSLIIVFLLISTGVSAQITEGHVKYKIDIDMDEKGNAMAVMMLKSASMEIFFKDSKTMVEFKMGAFANIKTITNSKTGDILMLTSGLIGNTATKTTISEIEDKTGGETVDEDDFNVVLYNETKTIQGYTCYKAILTTSDTISTTFWYTKEIEIDKAGHAYLNEKIPGLPMQFEMNQSGVMITVTASSFEKTVGKKGDQIFDMSIPEGYEEKSLDDKGGEK